MGIRVSFAKKHTLCCTTYVWILSVTLLKDIVQYSLALLLDCWCLERKDGPDLILIS